MSEKNHKLRNLKNKVCQKCGQIFKPLSSHQIYCGSKTKRMGCSWQNVLENHRKLINTEFWQKYYREYDKKWRKEQRLQNTPYAVRQRELQRAYYIKNCEQLKSNNKE